MTPLRALAELVRTEAEQWARDVGYESARLEMQCAVVSLAFVSAAARLGIQAVLAGGEFAGVDPPQGHLWAFAWEDGCKVVDLTATQYELGIPRVAIIGHQDPAVAFYLLSHVGDQAYACIDAQNRVEATELTGRVMRILDHAMERAAATRGTAPPSACAPGMPPLLAHNSLLRKRQVFPAWACADTLRTMRARASAPRRQQGDGRR